LRVLYLSPQALPPPGADEPHPSFCLFFRATPFPPLAKPSLVSFRLWSVRERGTTFLSPGFFAVFWTFPGLSPETVALFMSFSHWSYRHRPFWSCYGFRAKGGRFHDEPTVSLSGNAPVCLFCILCRAAAVTFSRGCQLSLLHNAAFSKCGPCTLRGHIFFLASFFITLPAVRMQEAVKVFLAVPGHGGPHRAKAFFS